MDTGVQVGLALRAPPCEPVILSLRTAIWIRRETDESKKPSGLLAEFRERDSYLNSDFESDEDETPGAGSSASKPQNSLIDLAEALLSLAKVVERPPGAPDPTITLRITRIPGDYDEDPRFQITFDYLRSIGVRLLFGELNEASLDSLKLPTNQKERKVVPSRRLALDSTALMALCSDLLHHPLPTSPSEAKKRFFRPKEALRDVPGGRAANGPGRDEDEDYTGQSQNSRELVKNLLEEMDSAVIEEMRETLSATLRSGETIEWWTTREAIGYLKETLGGEEIVGEGMEQMRMRRLIGLEDGDFFEGSRYEGLEGPLRKIRVKIFDEDKLDSIPPPTPFHSALADVAQSCLDDYHTWSISPSPDTAGALPNFLKPQRLPVPKVAVVSLPFPVVSLSVLARGSREGMTCVMMGNVLLRDLFGQTRWRVNGWAHACYSDRTDSAAEVDQGEGNAEGKEEAAVWMLPFRSMGEGKRVKFAQGDYSYPNR